MDYIEITAPFEIISLNVCDQEVHIEFYDDIVVFVFTSGHLGKGYGEIILTPEQVSTMMWSADNRITWRSSPSTTDPTICVYRGDYRTFTIDRVQWQGKRGVAEVYNRITFNSIERRKLFAKIRACQEKVKRHNETKTDQPL